MRKLFILFGLITAMFLASCTSRVVVSSQKTKVVKTAPKHHKIVIIKGKRYYFWNGRHYKKTNNGYVIVKV